MLTSPSLRSSVTRLRLSVCLPACRTQDRKLVQQMWLLSQDPVQEFPLMVVGTPARALAGWVSEMQ